MPKRDVIHLYVPGSMGERLDAVKDFYGAGNRTQALGVALAAAEREMDRIGKMRAGKDPQEEPQAALHGERESLPGPSGRRPGCR